MLKGMYLGGFKSFARTQYIPLRPITIMFGPNSGGKSSIIQSIALAGEIYKNEEWNISEVKNVYGSKFKPYTIIFHSLLFSI